VTRISPWAGARRYEPRRSSTARRAHGRGGRYFREGIYHPGPTIAAALAVAQSRRASGEQFLRAVIVGTRSPPHRRGHGPRSYSTGTTPEPSAVSARRAPRPSSRLDRRRFAHALATVATFSAGLQQAFRADSMSKPMHAGAPRKPASPRPRSSEGVTGSLDIMEGERASVGDSGDPDWERALATLDKDSTSRRMLSRTTPAAATPSPPSTGALALKGGWAWPSRRSRACASAATGDPGGGGDRGPATAAEARSARPTSSPPRSLRQRAACRVRAGAARGRRHKGAHAARRDGPRPRSRCGVSGAARGARRDRVARRPRGEHLQPTRKGDPDLPLSDAELEHKYFELASPVLGEEQARALLARLWKLEREPRLYARAGPVSRARRARRCIRQPGGRTVRAPCASCAKHGYAGRIVPINASRSEVLGEARLRRPRRGTRRDRHAFIMRPGDSVERAIEECGARGVPVATIFSDGFADAGAEGAATAGAARRARENTGVARAGPQQQWGSSTFPPRHAQRERGARDGRLARRDDELRVAERNHARHRALARRRRGAWASPKLVSVGNESDLGWRSWSSCSPRTPAPR